MFARFRWKRAHSESKCRRTIQVGSFCLQLNTKFRFRPGQKRSRRKSDSIPRDHAVLSVFLRQEPGVTVVTVIGDMETRADLNFGVLKTGKSVTFH